MVVMDVRRLIPSSRAKNYDVINPQGEDLGQVQNFMLDPATNRVAFVVVSFGGFLGLGDKWIAMPLDILQWDTDRAKFMLDVPRETLENARGLDKDRWPEEFDLTWLDEVYTCFNCQPYWDSESTWVTKEAQGGEHVVVGLARFKGIRTVNAAGEDIGIIEDVVIDLQSGCVAYVLTSITGYPALGEHTMAIPIQSFSLSGAEEALQLNIDEPHLSGAPAFSMERLQEDRGFLHATYMYYGYTPYWENHTIWRRRGAPLHPADIGATYKAELYLVTDLLADPVKDARGEDAGRLEDLMVDMESGYLASAVFSLDKMGLEGLYPLPLEVISYDMVRHEFYLAIDRDIIREAPAFEKGRLPKVDRTGMIRIYTAYGYTPYWREKKPQTV